MTATATRTAATQAAVRLTLDERLAFTNRSMDENLAGTHADMLIRTAHIDTEYPPILPTPAPGRPLADLLTRAARRLAALGWSRDTAGSSTGPTCPLYAIELEARGDEALAGQARTLLLETIRHHDRHVAGVPQWNARQAGPGPVIEILRQAASAA